MITLSKAFRLCGVTGNEVVYLKAADDPNHNEYWFWTGRIIELFDMKKIHVIKIRPKFSIPDFTFKGFVFTVRGMNADDLRKMSYKGFTR